MMRMRRLTSTPVFIIIAFLTLLQLCFAHPNYSPNPRLEQKHLKRSNAQVPFLQGKHNQPYPPPLSIANAPVHLRDPSIVYNPTLDQYIILSTGNEVLYFSSPNLTGPYIQAGSVLGNASKIGHSFNPWAPDITFVNNRYYVYYCVSGFGTQNSAIGLAVSSTGKEGSFQDLGALFKTRRGDKANAIDPNLVPGGEYLSYGSYFGGIFLVKLSDLTSVNKTALPGIKIADGFQDFNAVEGSFIYHRPPYYYLFVSNGQCCGFNQHELPENNTTEYKILVGRSRSIKGPYLDRYGVKMTQGGGSTVLSSFESVYAPGGQSIYKDPKSGRDVMVFHYSIPQNANLHARLGMYFLDFSQDSWPVVARD